MMLKEKLSVLLIPMSRFSVTDYQCSFLRLETISLANAVLINSQIPSERLNLTAMQKAQSQENAETHLGL